MTSEKRLVFDIGDVVTVICECNECGGRVGVPADHVLRTSSLVGCPYCEVQWVSPTQYENGETEVYVAFLNALASVNDAIAKRKVGFSFRLEFHDPS